MLVQHALHDWPRKADYGIDYGGRNAYSFFHFPIPFYIQINGEVVQCEPGACVLLPPLAYRYFHCYEPSTHNLLFLNPEAESLIKKYRIPENQLFYPENTAFISDIFRKMEIECYSKNPHKAELLDAYLEEFLILLSRELYGIENEGISFGEEANLRKVRYEVHSKCQEKWTVAQMAELASLSPSRFYSLYSKVFGTTPIADLAVAKIDYAKDLLRAKEHYSIPDITEKVGFQSQSHFIRKFKQITGTTPHKYRKRFQ